MSCLLSREGADMRYVLKNTCAWVKSASIKYVVAMEPIAWVLYVETYNKLMFEHFKTELSAKRFFSKHYKKGIWVKS